MEALELIDETFDRNRCDSYELSMQACPDGFYFAVKDTVRNMFIVMVAMPLPVVIANHENDWGDSLARLFGSYTWLKSSFKKVSLQYRGAPYSIVPSHLLQESSAKAVFMLTHDLPNSHELHIQEMAMAESAASVIFAIPTLLASEWVLAHPKTRFVAPVAHHCPKLYSHSGASHLMIDALQQEFTATYVKDGGIVAANTFAYTTPADFVYFTLGFCRSLGVDYGALEVMLVGEAQKQDEVEKLLASYFAQVTVNVQVSEPLFSYRLMKYRGRFFSLFNQGEPCE